MPASVCAGTTERINLAAEMQRELCPGCKTQLETPTHFLLECPAYAALRPLGLKLLLQMHNTETAGHGVR